MDTIRTPEKRAEFLTALSSTGSVAEACRQASVARNSMYLWRNSDEGFAADWDKYLEAGAQLLEDEAKRRAHDGYDEPVFYKGEMVATTRKYSDTLLIFLLKGLIPHRYGDRMAHTGADGGPIQAEITVNFVKPDGSADRIS
jgi:hypothetical protein